MSTVQWKLIVGQPFRNASLDIFGLPSEYQDSQKTPIDESVTASATDDINPVLPVSICIDSKLPFVDQFIHYVCHITFLEEDVEEFWGPEVERCGWVMDNIVPHASVKYIGNGFFGSVCDFFCVLQLWKHRCFPRV
ncbi:hypothetical protein VM1G_04682 [Cytospora mali]|uniref:Uncharacterized protein n=1 Tax=Cytospora mali TaxID=578113 RepID=A0A194VXD0_CYTMA|nr:hypothetical protein VM1G_04682 [Valsa mali]